MGSNFSEENHQQLGALRADVDRVQEDITEIRSDLKAVLSTLSEAKGYWKMLLIIAGFAGAVGAFVSKLIAWVPLLPRQ